MRSFVYNGQPSRVVFGAGSLEHLEREVQLLGANRALVLCTPEQQTLAEDMQGDWEAARPVSIPKP